MVPSTVQCINQVAPKDPEPRTGQVRLAAAASAELFETGPGPYIRRNASRV